MNDIRYKIMQKFPVNMVFKVYTKKHHDTIKIYTIEQLSWKNLQKLILCGENTIRKKELLCQYFLQEKTKEELGFRGTLFITEKEEKEINKFIDIYINFKFITIQNVNTYITENNMWDMFKNIRSMNTYSNSVTSEGVQPMYYNYILKKINGNINHKYSLLEYKIY